MKKLLALLLVLITLISALSACGEKPPAAPADDATAADTQTSDSQQPSSDEPEEKDKETTVITPPDTPVIITTDPSLSGNGNNTETSQPSAQPSSQQTAPDTQAPQTTSPEAQTPAEKPPVSQTPPASSDGYPRYNVSSTGKDYNIFFHGDGILYESANFMGSLALEDGILFPIYGANMGYNNLNQNSTYNLYEAFKYSGAELTGPGNRIANILDISQPLIDYAVVGVSRDRALATADNEKKTLSAIKELNGMLHAQNPNGKLVLVVPPAYKDGCTFFSEKMSVKDISGKEHDDKIHALAEKAAAQAPGAMLVQLGDAYTFFNTNYASSKIDLYLRDLRSPSAAGSYYIACVLYASIFGKSPYGKEFSASLTADEAKLLQQAAHEFVFGSKPTSAAKPSPYPIIKLEDDPRFKNQKFPTGYDAFLATAWAYYDRHICVQYDQLATDRLGYTFYRRTVDGTADPEEGTPQKTLYLDCTAFVWSLLKSAYNYSLPENRSKALSYNSTPELSPLIVYEHTPGSDRAEETVIQDIIEALQPGDVIAYSNPDNTGGHGVIYLGNGYVMQCSSSSRLAGGNADYNKTGNVDAHEGYGGIRVDKIDFLIDPHRLSYHFEPGKDFTTRIIRPDYSKLNPTEDAVNRAKNMLHIVAYKLTSAPEGVSVNPGDTVDFTIVVKNLNNEPRTVTVTDVLPAGLTLKSGSNNFTLSLAAGETKSQTYTVTVDANAKKGSYIEYKTTKAGGVTLNNAPVYVGSTLSPAEKQKLSAAANAATGSSTFDIIKAAYDALGVTLPFDSASAAYSGVFKADAQYGSKGGICLNTSGAAAKTVAHGIYGGRYFVNENNEHRLKYVSVDNLIPGDILLAVEENNGKISYELYFYVADRTFKYVKDGKTVQTSNSSDCQELIERVWGENAFVVIRPSLAK